MSTTNASACAGKGGVGKSFSASSLALYDASLGKKTGLIDFDGGHSIKRTMQLDQVLRDNRFNQLDGAKDLFVSVVQPEEFFDIGEVQSGARTFNEYYDQFPDDMGLTPWADMPNKFWGIPAEPSELRRYLTLVMLLNTAKEKGFDQVYIDIEPTAGFERMVQAGPAIAKGLENLNKQGFLMLQLLGAKWPDIKKYIESEYVICSEEYMRNMALASNLVKESGYYFVSLAEESPVEQTFQNREIVAKYGGVAKACIVNNLRGEDHEVANIQRLEEHGLPIARVGRRDGMHVGGENRFELLRSVGEEIMTQLHAV